METVRDIYTACVDRLRSIEARSGGKSEHNAEKEVLNAFETAAAVCVREKECACEALRQHCCELAEQLTAKRKLLWTETVVHCDEVKPPYAPLVVELKKELAKTDALVSQRDRERTSLRCSIQKLCTELELAMPDLPGRLTADDMAVIQQELIKLQEEKQEHVRVVNSYNEKLKALHTFLFYPALPPASPASCEGHPPLSVSTIAAIQAEHQRLAQLSRERKTTISRLSSQCLLLAQMLECPADIGCSDDGSAERVEKLEHTLAKLHATKAERVETYIEKSFEVIEKLWDEVYLGPKFRQHVDAGDVSESTLQKVDDEIKRLEELKANPQRRQIISMIKQLDGIHSRELKLAEAAADSGRLNRGGFAKVLKLEEEMRNYVAQHKPRVISKLREMLGEWEQTNEVAFGVVREGEVVDLVELLREEHEQLHHRDTQKRRRLSGSLEAPPAKRNLPNSRAPSRINPRATSGLSSNTPRVTPRTTRAQGPALAPAPVPVRTAAPLRTRPVETRSVQRGPARGLPSQVRPSPVRPIRAQAAGTPVAGSLAQNARTVARRTYIPIVASTPYSERVAGIKLRQPDHTPGARIPTSSVRRPLTNLVHQLVAESDEELPKGLNMLARSYFDITGEAEIPPSDDALDAQ